LSCHSVIVALTAAALLACAGCGPRPNEANQRQIVLHIQTRIGAVKSFRFLPVLNRCELEFECVVLPYSDGVPRLYRGTFGYGVFECHPAAEDAEEGVTTNGQT
jgi:hypothetical protein